MLSKIVEKMTYNPPYVPVPVFAHEALRNAVPVPFVVLVPKLIYTMLNEVADDVIPYVLT